MTKIFTQESAENAAMLGSQRKTSCYTVLDTFSGIGGFSLGLESTGAFRTVAFCEIDPFARQVLNKHWPEVPIYEDVRTLHVRDLPEWPNVITGGYPCQPFSLAGERRGQEDDRHLWPELLRLTQEGEPDWLLAENVFGHIALGLDEVLADLENEGYACWPFVIPACAIGAAHKRDRVWLVANSERKRWEGRKQNNSLPVSAKEAHSKLSDCLAGTWDEMARRSRNLRSSDGLSVQMVRNECKGYGNAVVPQIPYMIGEAIKAVACAV